uniref:Chitin-binding type-2 domain-containing protein n=1 Tax=Steinernema glaseri TaxID=37863 RepID=A0A1I8AQG5_9BILA
MTEKKNRNENFALAYVRPPDSRSIGPRQCAPPRVRSGLRTLRFRYTTVGRSDLDLDSTSTRSSKPLEATRSPEPSASCRGNMQRSRAFISANATSTGHAHRPRKGLAARHYSEWFEVATPFFDNWESASTDSQLPNNGRHFHPNCPPYRVSLISSPIRYLFIIQHTNFDCRNKNDGVYEEGKCLPYFVHCVDEVALRSKCLRRLVFLKNRCVWPGTCKNPPPPTPRTPPKYSDPFRNLPPPECSNPTAYQRLLFIPFLCDRHTIDTENLHQEDQHATRAKLQEEQLAM